MKKREFSQEEKERLIYDYTVLKVGQKRLAEKYHTSDRKIREVLDKLGIVRKTVQETNINSYGINHHFFNPAQQTANMAYILGLIASDGCISASNNQIYIELQRNDKEILERVNATLENEREVKDYTNARNYDNSKVFFFSKQIKEDLKQYHLVPNKTYSSEYCYPELLEEKYFFDYLLGLFDGDGSIKTSRDWAAWQVDTSSKDVVEKIQQHLKKYDIDININIEKKTNINIYRCITYKKDNLYKLYKLLYYNIPHQLFLKRKYEKFTQILNDIAFHETDYPLSEDKKIC